MRVILHRSGGFAGLPREFVVDSAELTDSQERSLRTALAAAEKADQATVTPERAVSDQADRFVFRLTIIDADDTREIRFSESTELPELRVLVTRIEKYSTGGAP